MWKRKEQWEEGKEEEKGEKLPKEIKLAISNQSIK